MTDSTELPTSTERNSCTEITAEVQATIHDGTGGERDE